MGALPIASFLVAVGGGLAWSAFDAGRKVLVARMRPVPILALLCAGQAVVFLALVMRGTGPSIPLAYAPFAIGSACLGILGNLLFLRSVQLSALSVTVPLLSFSPVLAAILAGALLGERPSAIQIVAAVLVVAGALLINSTREEGLRPVALVRALTRERGTVMMAGVALVWATASVVDKRALAYVSVPVHGLARSSMMTIALVTLLAVRGEQRDLASVRSNAGAYAWTIGASVAALSLEFVALRLMLVSVQDSIKRAVGMAMSVVIGRLAFREPVRFAKLAAITLMGAGMVLVLTPWER